MRWLIDSVFVPNPETVTDQFEVLPGTLARRQKSLQGSSASLQNVTLQRLEKQLLTRVLRGTGLGLIQKLTFSSVIDDVVVDTKIVV